MDQDDKAGVPSTQMDEAKQGVVVKLTDFAIAVFGDASKNFGSLVADQIGYWRLRNLLRISVKWEEELKAKGLSPRSENLRHLSFSEAFRITEAASLEEEDEIQLMWASLIAALHDPAENLDLKKYLIDILKSLEPPDAALIMVLHAWNGPWHMPSEGTSELSRIEKIRLLNEKYWMSYDQDTRSASIKNLFRLGCIQHAELPHIMLGNREEGSGGRYRMPEANEENIPETVRHLIWLSDVIQARIDQFHDRGERHGRSLIEILNAGDTIGSSLGEMVAAHDRSPFRLTELGRDLARACYGKEIDFEKHLGPQAPS